MVQIDRNKNVGITNTLKSYASFSSDNTMIMHNAELIPSKYSAKSLMTPDGYFNFCAQHVVGLLRKLQTCDN